MRLYVGRKSCTIPKAMVIPVGFSISAMQEPQMAIEGRQVEIVIPSTAESNAIFGVARDIYALERFNSRHHEARVDCGGVEMLSGTIYILSASMNDRQAGEYKVRIVVGGCKWAKDAAQTLLQSSGLRVDMELTPEAIMESWQGEQAVRFLPVLRNRYPSVYSGVSAAPLEHIMTVDDFHPFFSVAAVFEKVFKGYTVKSDFLNSDIFKQLHFSGQYDSPNTIKQQALLDFKARRKQKVTATADSYGKVYATVSFDGDSALGNIVDTANPTEVDSNGRLMQDTFTTGNVFTINEDGYCQFQSTIAANVGFILHLEYTTDYHIVDRRKLRCFDRIIAEPGVDVQFVVANGYTDQRDSLIGGITYNLCIFDFIPEALYMFEMRDKVSGNLLESRVIDSRFTPITIPEGCSAECSLKIMLGEKVEFTTDWALYFGFVEEYGQTEVNVDVRIPPQQFSAGEKMQFNRIKLAGAEPGMKITLSTACSLRPYFSSVPGYGSQIGIADIAHQDIWLIEVVEAVCKMFNLAIFTDEQSKTVFIEPLEELYSDKVWDWSGKVDYSEPITIADMGVDQPHWFEWQYRSGDYATEQYNELYATQLGCWRVENPTYGAKDSTKRVYNPLFTTGVNKCGQYALAPSASIHQVGDSAAEGAMDAPFTPHIVRYVGLRPLPAAEQWGYPINDNYYPLAAFFFEGDGYTDGFSLCYEDRDRVGGLHRYFDRAAERMASKQRLTLTLHLTPIEVLRLMEADGGFATIRDTFRLDILGESSLYRLESIGSYDCAKGLAKCTFIRLTND